MLSKKCGWKTRHGNSNLILFTSGAFGCNGVIMKNPQNSWGRTCMKKAHGICKEERWIQTTQWF